MIFLGVGCLVVLLVISAVALVRDRRMERADRRRLTAIVEQVQQQMRAELGEPWTPRQT